MMMDGVVSEGTGMTDDGGWLYKVSSALLLCGFFFGVVVR